MHDDDDGDPLKCSERPSSPWMPCAAAAARRCWRPRGGHPSTAGIHLDLSHVPAAALAISSTLG